MRRRLTLTACLFLAFASTATASTPYRTHKAGDYPPHHRLWLCINHYEGGGRWDWYAGRSYVAHAGGLGMAWSWGYGIVGNPANYSQTDQEWAAERGYRASGFSHNWVYRQWFEWEPSSAQYVCGRLE